MTHAYSPRHVRYEPRHGRRPTLHRHYRAISGVLLLPVATVAILLTQVHHEPVTLNDSAGTAVADLPARATGSRASPGKRGAVAPPPQQPSTKKRTTVPAPSSSPAPAPIPPAAPSAPTKMLNYQFQWQPNGYWCAPAATRIAVTARGLYPSQGDLANRLGTTVNGTGSADDTTRVLNSVGNTTFYKSHFIRGESATRAEIDQLKADVLNAIGKGFPVVANIAGAATDTDGKAHSYPGGHYLTVVGYADSGQIVKIADPADAYGRGSYLMATQRFAHWIATRGYSA
jgi:Peptidase_C39 like family